MNIADNVRQRLRTAFAAAAPVAQPAVIRRNKSGFLTLFLASCIVFLSVASVVVYAAKESAPIERETNIEIAGEANLDFVKLAEKAFGADAAAKLLANFGSRSHGNLETRVQKLEQQVQVWAMRTWLLSVANNENCHATQQALKRNPNYVYFDHDWKINRMPSTLIFDDRSKQELRKHVK